MSPRGTQGLSQTGRGQWRTSLSQGEEAEKCNTNYMRREIKNDFKFYFPVSQHIPWCCFI